MDENIMSLVRKLKALSEQGVDGEKETATDKLRRLMDKHGITWDMLDSEVRKRKYFLVHNDDKKFFFQVVASVLGQGASYTEFRSDKNKVKKRYGIEVTDIEFIEIDSKFDFYLKKYKEDLEIFYSAFVQKNKLYAKPSDSEDDDDKEMTLEEKQRLFKLMQMMSGMDKHTMQKQIENK